MKLIIAGASGFVAQELLRQSLKRPDITSVIALSRKPVTTPAPADVGGEANVSKLRSVVLKDYDEYPEEICKEFRGADACIWTVAITPSRSKAFAWEEVVRVCQTSTLAGLKAMYASEPKKPFRFLYVSGIGAERDKNKTPRGPAWMAEYSWMRGETETQILAFAKEHEGEIEASAAKPGLITSPGKPITSIFAKGASALGIVPCLDRRELVTAMLEQVFGGFESDALMHDDLVRIAKAVEGTG